MDDRLVRLASKRAAYVAAWTDGRVLADETHGSYHSACVTFFEFRAFAKSVWVAEGRAEILYVKSVEELPPAVQEREFEGAAAAARWAMPSADRIGIARTGELAGTTGAVPYLDVKDEGLQRLVALHELAHLSVDTLESALGHGREWADTYSELIQRHLGQDISLLWQAQFRWWWAKAKEKIAADPEWLA